MKLSPLTADKRGQLSVALVWGIIMMLVAVSIGGLLFGRIQDTATTQADDDNDAIDTIAENIVADVGETGSDVFPLILLAVTVSVFIAILAMFKYLG